MADATRAEGAAPPPKRRDGRAYRQKHGLYGLQKRVGRQSIHKAVDGRSVAKALKAWENELVDDLGGAEHLSTQRRAIVDMAVRTKLYVDSIDAWLAADPSRALSKRHRRLFPVVLERLRLVDSLQRQLEALGLDRQRVERRVTPDEYMNGGQS